MEEWEVPPQTPALHALSRIHRRSRISMCCLGSRSDTVGCYGLETSDQKAFCKEAGADSDYIPD